jgi:cytochrome c
MRAVTSALFMSAILAAPSAWAQDEGGAKDGQAAFNNACRTCHTVKEGDNRQGPNLAGIVGKKSGQVEGWSYSGALADGRITWDEATLDKFIENPEAVAPGNNMKPFGGIAEAEQRKLIVSYLAEQSGGGADAAPAADAEKPAEAAPPAE